MKSLFFALFGWFLGLVCAIVFVHDIQSERYGWAAVMFICFVMDMYWAEAWWANFRDEREE